MTLLATTERPELRLANQTILTSQLEEPYNSQPHQYYASAQVEDLSSEDEDATQIPSPNAGTANGGAKQKSPLARGAG